MHKSTQYSIKIIMFVALNLWTQYQSIMMFGEMFIYHICACEHFCLAKFRFCIMGSAANKFTLRRHDLLHFDSVFLYA